MSWYPPAIRKVVARHRTPMARYRGVCNHVAVSEGASLFSYFNQPGNPSSHFYVRRDGAVEQYVDTQFRAPANVEGNSSLISIETQGGVRNVDSEPWTADQVDALARIAAWTNRVHGIPLVQMADSLSETRGIGYHRLGIDPWRVPGGERWSLSYGKICPGAGKIAQIPTIIASARALVGGGLTMADAASLERQLTALGANLTNKVNQAINQAASATNVAASDVAIDRAQTALLHAQEAFLDRLREDLGTQFTALGVQLAAINDKLDALLVTSTAEPGD